MKRALEPGTLALAKARSTNAKIGDAATTYAAQTSCPTSCVFFDGGGCYAEEGPLGKFVTGPLNKAAALAEGHTPLDVAQAEADAIDALEVVPGFPMRLHTVGDCSTTEAAQVVAAAAWRYMHRGGGPVWTYTHAWRTVPRWAWHGVDVLASCETPDDVAEAHARGYATAMVVAQFEQRSLYKADGVHVLPCPAQTTGGVSCSSCRLCMDSGRLHGKGLTIAFALHGVPVTMRRARLALNDPENPDRKLSSRVLIPREIERFKTEHGREPNNRELAEALDMSESSVWEMRKSIRLGGPARPARRGRTVKA